MQTDLLDEAKKKQAPEPEPTPEPSGETPKYKVIFHHSDEFNDTYDQHSVNTPGVSDAMDEFYDKKMANPNAKFGSKDYPLGNHFDKKVPGIKHAGLTFDKSVFYTLSGKGDTRHIHLYGIYGHDDAGIGQPDNIKKQKSLAKRLGNQEFDD